MAESSVRIAALVPMRHSSERVRGKNYRPLGGRPLFHHIVGALEACPEIAEIAIDTDSELIKEDLASSFPGVRVIDRPAELLGGDVPMNDILAHDVTLVDADLYLQTHSTNPLLRAETISAAVRAFLEQRDRYDSLFSVTPLQVRLWTADGKPINHDPEVLLRTQDLPPVMEENSCLYLFDRATLERTGRRIGDRPLLFPIERGEAVDIDDESDWSLVEALFERSPEVTR
jgi:CMP-N-acetylneuraminic acid synthetase